MAYNTPEKKKAADKKRALLQAIKYQEFVRAYKNQPCIDCENKFPPEAMDFDHVRGKKLFSIGNGKNRPLAVLLTEIEKCDLVCANCHRVRTKRRQFGT